MTTYTVEAEKSVATVTTLVLSAGGSCVASVGQIVATFADGSGAIFDSHEAFDAIFSEVPEKEDEEDKADDEEDKEDDKEDDDEDKPKAAKKEHGSDGKALNSQWW